jgi:hypothetical protein
MMHRLAVALLALLAPLAMPGCSSSPPPATGTFHAVTRELEATLDAPLERAFAAAEQAVRDMKFEVVSARSDVLQGVVRSRMADGTGVDVDLKKITDRTTLVRIKVGTLGDQAVSRSLLDQIRKHI